MIEILQQALPRPTLKKKVVVHRQGVYDIMSDVVKAHNDYAKDYDKICSYFWKGSEKKTIKFLFDFCKKNLPYKAETDQAQTVRSPAAILETASTWGVDCKHYAGFIAGVLDGLNRQGKNFDWRYRFVSYTPDDATPEHVFIVADLDGKKIFIDPVLENLDQRFPKYYYFQEKFPMLSRVNGVGIPATSLTDEFGNLAYTNTKFNIAPTGGGGGAVQTMVPLEPGAVTTTQAGNGGGGGVPGWVWLVVGGLAIYYFSKK